MSGISRSSASRTSVFLRMILPNNSRRALDRAGERLRASCRRASRADPDPGAPGGDVAAHGAGADDVNVLTGAFVPSARFFICSRRKNTRIRFCAVGVTISLANEVFSARSIAVAIAAVLFPQIDQRIGRGIMFLGRGLARLRLRIRVASKSRAPDRRSISATRA